MIRSDSDTVREVLDTPIRGEYDVIVCGGEWLVQRRLRQQPGRTPGYC